MLWFSSATSSKFGEGFRSISSFGSKFSNKFGCGSSRTFQTDEIDCDFMNENKKKIIWLTWVQLAASDLRLKVYR
jgi:hypothetical protein